MKKGMVFLLVAVVVFSSILLPSSSSHLPLAPSNPDPWTANNTVTISSTGPAPDITTNISDSAPTYDTTVVAYYNYTSASTIVSGAKLAIGLWGVIGIAREASTDYQSIGSVTVTFYIGSNVQSMSYTYNYFGDSGLPFFEFYDTAVTSYSGSLSKISIEETDDSGNTWTTEPGTLYTESSITTNATTSSSFSASTQYNIATNNGYAYSGSTPSSFSSQLPSNLASFKIYWSAQQPTTATYDGTGYGSTPITGVAGQYSISFSSVNSVLSVSSYTVTYNESYIVAYSVTFTESGLPSGTTWYMNITSGSSYSSTASTITVSEPNGTYSYTIATNNKEYAPSPSSGTFTVAGVPLSESVTLSLVTYSVTFTETGLPSSTKWYVNFTNGQTFSSTSSTVSFTEPNGTYTFDIATPDKLYSPNPSTNSFTVNGATVAESISFSELVYSITFTQSGLASGTWYLNITGGGTYSSATTSLSFSEPNGTYSYTVTTNNKEYAPSPSSGSFTVSGSPVSESITFNQVRFKVTFTESGLPVGTSWWVNLSGTKNTSTSSSISFYEFNGSYSYAVLSPINGSYGIRYSSSQSSGSVTINGAPLSISIPYTTQYYLSIAVSPPGTGNISESSGWYNSQQQVSLQASPNKNFQFISWSGTGSGGYSGTSSLATVTMKGPINETANFGRIYYVTFTESGLPSGTKWFVNVSGPRSYSSSSTMISFPEVNGTYSYAIVTDRRYETPVPAGSITIQGQNVSISVGFSLVTYQVEFIEIGLPSGQSWYVSLNGTTSPSTTNSSILFFMPNGTYPFSVSPVTGLIVEPDSGDVAVSGSNVVVNIVLQSQGSGSNLVSFIETGLPSGGEWFVTFNGFTESSFSSVIQFYIANGTYPYSITGTKGYYATPDFGNLSIRHNYQVNVQFSNSSGGKSTTIDTKIVEQNLPLIIGLTALSIIVGWILSVFVNPENWKKRSQKKIEKKGARYK